MASSILRVEGGMSDDAESAAKSFRLCRPPASPLNTRGPFGNMTMSPWRRVGSRRSVANGLSRLAGSGGTGFEMVADGSRTICGLCTAGSAGTTTE
jgi:hypothetical protein